MPTGQLHVTYQQAFTAFNKQIDANLGVSRPDSLKQVSYLLDVRRVDRTHTNVNLL